MGMRIVNWLLLGVLFVLLLEVFARIEDRLRWDAPLLASYRFDDLRQRDDAGTLRCAPNGRYKNFSLDDQGFRLTGEHRSGPKLAWLGASEAFGLYESPGKDVANVLEQTLALSGGQVEVINASCFGLNVRRMQRVLRNQLGQTPLAAVVLYPTPHFYLDIKPVADDLPRKSRSRPSPLASFRLPGKAKEVIKAFLPTTAQDFLRRWAIERTVAKQPADWVWTEVPEDRLDLFEQDVRQLLRSAIASGAPVALMTHSIAFSDTATPDPSVMLAWRRFYPRATQQVLLEFDALANQRLRSLALEFEVELIDTAQLINGRSEMFADFSHFSDSGAAQVAEAVAQWAETEVFSD